MGFSRDELPWVGPVPASLLARQENREQESMEKDTGLFIAAGFTGHGMPNTWLCGRAVAEMVAAEGGGDGVEIAVRNTGLPTAYLVSEERVERARELESVVAKDWTEMERLAQRARTDRPSSGYA